jgi:hypothetical protein
MKRSLIVGFAVIAATLLPWTATATATGDPSIGGIDIVYAEMDGSGEFNVWGTVRCTGVGPLNLDIQFVQPSTSGVGAGASNDYTCLAPGQTIKWVMDAQGGPLLVDAPVTITAFAAGSTVATDTENHVLHWGLPSADDDD